jgi:hypothetical protein
VFELGKNIRAKILPENLRWIDTNFIHLKFADQIILFL